MQIDFKSGILNCEKLHSDVKYLGNGSNLLIFPKLIEIKYYSYKDFWFFGSTSSLSLTTSLLSSLFIFSLSFFWAVDKLKMCMVPLSEEHATNLETGSNAILYMSAFSVPLLSSCKKDPSSTLNILIRVPYLIRYANYLIRSTC